jgi:uncharacterized membrane protein
MEPALGVALYWLLFGGTHVGLATRRVRGALVAHLGEWGFIGMFSLVAALTFTTLVRYYADHQFVGAAGLAAGANALVRGLAISAIVGGVTLAMASLWTYPASPYALGNERVHEPRGLERVTRHPFAIGVAIAATAHALLATRLTGTVFFAGLALLGLAGSVHQDRKLLAARGAAYAHFVSVTSMLPFGAVLSGRQRLVWHELPWTALLAALGAAYGLRVAHASIFAHGGVWVIAVVVGGAAVLALQSWRHATRSSRPARALSA